VRPHIHKNLLPKPPFRSDQLANLSEVERARKLVKETCVGFKIASVDSREDKIVYTGGITHEDYVRGRSDYGCRLPDLTEGADIILLSRFTSRLYLLPVLLTCQVKELEGRTITGCSRKGKM
jgi:hypothetical protein